MKQLILGLIVFGLLCFGIGASIGIIYENISLNMGFEDKIISISNSEKPYFRIGNDLYRVEKFTGLVINDTIIRTPQYIIK